jgi:hypothetical protein
MRMRKPMMAMAMAPPPPPGAPMMMMARSMAPPPMMAKSSILKKEAAPRMAEIECSRAMGTIFFSNDSDDDLDGDDDECYMEERCASGVAFDMDYSVLQEIRQIQKVDFKVSTANGDMFSRSWTIPRSSQRPTTTRSSRGLSTRRS